MGLVRGILGLFPAILGAEYPLVRNMVNAFSDHSTAQSNIPYRKGYGALYKR